MTQVYLLIFISWKILSSIPVPSLWTLVQMTLVFLFTRIRYYIFLRSFFISFIYYKVCPFVRSSVRPYPQVLSVITSHSFSTRLPRSTADVLGSTYVVMPPWTYICTYLLDIKHLLSLDTVVYVVVVSFFLSFSWDLFYSWNY